MDAKKSCFAGSVEETKQLFVTAFLIKKAAPRNAPQINGGLSKRRPNSEPVTPTVAQVISVFKAEQLFIV
jgi:hypothetical protein